MTLNGFSPEVRAHKLAIRTIRIKPFARIVRQYKVAMEEKYKQSPPEEQAMLPIIGSPDNSNSPLTNLQSEQTDEETSSAPETNDSGSDASNGGGGEDAVKLDLGSSGENGVHQETARFIAERSIQVQISQSFSFTQQNITDSAIDAVNVRESNSPEEETARTIAGEAERFLPRFLEESEGSEQDARQEFQDIISGAVEEGLREAQEELNQGFDSEIQSLFQNIQTALDRFIEVFGEDEDSTEDKSQESDGSTGSAETQNQVAEQAIENQNQLAAANTVPETLSGSLISQ